MILRFQRDEIRTLVDWAAAKAPAGKPEDAPPAQQLRAGMEYSTAGHGDSHAEGRSDSRALWTCEYTYEIVPTDFTEDKWVRISEIRPSSRANVHHAVVYIRPPDSPWLRHAPIGAPFTASDMTTEQDRRDTRTTKADILLVYAPGSSPDTWPEGMAKFIPAGSDLVFQMHYTSLGRPAMDQTEIGMVFAKQPPTQRVLTLQLTNSSFVIPPGVDD